MILIQGKGVSKGIAKGPLCFFSRSDNAVIRQHGMNPGKEKTRFNRARRASVAQLEALTEKCRTESGHDSALLFETHALLVDDEDYVQYVHSILNEETCNAEYAVQMACNHFSEMFDSMDDSYMQARASDIRDISRRIIGNLSGEYSFDLITDEPVILAADDLSPSETIQLDKSKILAFITRKGSGNSHTAILARTIGIPAICRLGDSLKPEYSGQIAYIDGETGQVILDPDHATQSALDEKYHRQLNTLQILESAKGLDDVTSDGQKINIYCNIGSPEDVAAVLANDAHGIGLFRSEFLYLASENYPTEEQQFQAYRTVASAMDGKPVIIRTLDIGADKQADYFGMKKEENPALGVRGIRICLNRPEVFRPQLRALYRASAYGRIAIMFPMITSVWEVRECRRACHNIMAELDSEGIPFDRNTALGVMIETPASVLVADALAREVDFFSVGTNDLTQYMLACDRQCNDLGKFFDPHHPAVLRALKMTADAAHAAGIWIGICGELASDPELLSTFLAMGIDELSVSPSAVLPLRMEIRQSIAKTCTLDKLEC